MDQFLFLLTISAALCTMLLGGNFFAFSALFLRALGGLTAERGIVAMQAALAAAKTQALLVLFFGTAVVCLVLGALAAFHWRDPFAPYALAGAIVFLLGGFAVTMLRIVPLNNTLLAASPDAANAREHWREFRVRWARWNHLRMIATLLACVCFMLALSQIGFPFELT
ncbi:anthrone oxygenase family protein [Methyloceanibacter sp.]|uniref:anthrone oxygenase family protein n=1 Tax=Methyloceanibacter sp. TaxID=1965321 RepID=UPI002C7E3884|nr:anthrone oxygenase family protein [Methyloceanibacter sp.]HML93154.1 DUF1772 domain-containing protein [Methyloceanibacter sp.]